MTESKHDDFSIVSQSYKDYEERLAPPSIQYPRNEAITRSEFSNLPDGSFYDDLLTVPLGETLDKAEYRISRAASEAWQPWIESLLESSDAKTIDELLLTSEEDKYFTRIRRLRLVDDSNYQKQETISAERAINETKWISDRIHIKVSSVERVNGTPSLAERDRLAMTTNFETNLWRKSYSSYMEDNYIPNIGMQDDPDFIAPNDISSRNFVTYPPAARTYNATYKVVLDNGSEKLIYPDTRKSKDYTSRSSIEYMLNHKKVKFKSVSIHEVRRKTKLGITDHLACSFEPDVRVTYGEDLFPDPTSYKKVDTDTNLGKSFLQKLNEQPHLFQITIFESAGGHEDLVVYYAVPGTKDGIGPRVYWVYVDNNTYPIAKLNSKGQHYFLLAKKVLPQITYKPLRFYLANEGQYSSSHPFTASVRVTDGVFYRHADTLEWVNFSDIEEQFINKLSSQGYILLDKVREEAYSNVFVYKFIHSDTRTREQRNAIFLSLTKQNKSDD